MDAIFIALASAGCIFLGALIGIWLQRLLPGHHLTKELQDIVKLSGGMIATLTALVLGLLVSSAKSTFDTMNSGIVQSSAKVILLDRALSRYGPETKSAREQLKRSIAATIDTGWPTEKTGVSVLSTIERANGMELVHNKLSELKPQNDTQRQQLAEAQQTVSTLSQTRWLLIEQEQSSLPLPLLVILVFWLTLLFVSFGLFAPTNATALTVLFVGSCAVSAAIFLVLELNQPLEGFIKVSSAPLRNALQHLNQ
jgi:Na+/H+ antiporter NhaC